MNAIALAVATGCVGWRDSAGAGGKEPAFEFCQCDAPNPISKYAVTA